MQINKFSLLLLLTGAAFFVLPLKAQVNVGSENTPQPFSLLELTTSIQKGGLRLPQLTTKERDDLDITAPDLDAAQGLVIYNTDIDCVEFYNSEKGKWISLCNDTIPSHIAPTVYPNGSGLLNGKFCFDVAQDNDTVWGAGGPHDTGGWRKKYKADFNKDSIRIQTYTFTPNDENAISNLSFTYIENQPGLIVDSLVYDPAYETANNITTACTATLYYKKSLNESAHYRTQKNPLTVDIYVIFNNRENGTGTKQAVKMTATIKDGGCCGAIARTRTALPADDPRGYNVYAYRVYMCHNLGADESADPFIPGPALHGAKYKWGFDTPAVKAEQDTTSSSIIGWASIGGTPPTTANWDMTTANPCPAGYRVPATIYNYELRGSLEWPSIYTNSMTIEGKLVNDPNNWTSGLLIGQIGDGVFFPATGYRTGSPIIGPNGRFAVGDIYGRGLQGYYWTSSQATSGNVDGGWQYNIPSDLASSNPDDINYYITTGGAGGKTNGLAVRCIAE